jgi:hypothetical protein
MASGEERFNAAGLMIAAVLTFSALAVACSKPEPKNENKNSAASRLPTAASPPAAMNSETSAIPANVPAPGNVEYFQNDAGNRIGKGSTLERARRRPRPDADPNASPVPPTLSAAPEDSEGAITMLPDGTISEIRVFKSHPSLARVDTFIARSGPRTVRFTFRDGRVVERKTDKIDNLLNTPVSTLLQIAASR